MNDGICSAQLSDGETCGLTGPLGDHDGPCVGERVLARQAVDQAVIDAADEWFGDVAGTSEPVALTALSNAIRARRAALAPPAPVRHTYLLMSDFERLEEWCRNVRIAFDGATPYLVGSATTRPDYRDVDLRLILADEIFDAQWSDWVKVRLVNRAISIWGQEETGLPIDFQIQRRTEASAEFGHEARHPMGIRNWKTIPTSGVPL